MTSLFKQHKHNIIKLMTPIALKMDEPIEWIIRQVQEDLIIYEQPIEEYIRNVIEKEKLGFNHSSFNNEPMTTVSVCTSCKHKWSLNA